MTMIRTATYLFFVFILFSPASALAHESKRSGDTVVFVHTNPNDQAVTNKKGTFYILITKNRYQFSIEDCDCRATVTDAKGKIISSQPFTGKVGNAYVPYLLTKPGVHTVRVDGNPKERSTFEPFSLSFDIVVDRPSVTDMLKDKKVLYSLIGIVLLLSFLVMYTKEYLIRKYKRSIIS